MEGIGGEALERCVLGGSRIKLPSWQKKKKKKIEVKTKKKNKKPKKTT